MQKLADKPLLIQTTKAPQPTGGDMATQHLRPAPPAKEFLNGRIVTRVWANQNHWGGITWRIDQIRIRYGYVTNTSMARSFHLEDISDAIRGLYLARQWIKKTERRKRWPFLSLKCW